MVRLTGIVNPNSEQISLYFIIILELCSAVVALCTGANLHIDISSSSKGFRFLGIALIFIGVSLLILFFVTSWLAHRNNFRLVIVKSLCCSVPLVLGLLALGIFALAVSSTKGRGKYDVESYSEWMRNKVNDDKWKNYYKKVLVTNKELVCNKNVGILGADPALERGCCQPPKECNYEYTNSQVWAKLENGNYSNVDCSRWDSDPNTLCFDCESCKAGFLRDITSHWFTTGIGLIVVSIVPLLVAMVGFICFMFISGGEPSQLYRPLN